MANEKLKKILITERDRTEGLLESEVLLSVYDDGTIEILKLNIYTENGTITNTGDIRIPLSKLAFESSKATVKEQKKQSENKAGWQTHPGTHCGHYFPAGEMKSLCSRERRASGGDTLDDCTIKCTICQKRVGEPRTVNLFAAMD